MKVTQLEISSNQSAARLALWRQINTPCMSRKQTKPMYAMFFLCCLISSSRVYIAECLCAHYDSSGLYSDCLLIAAQHYTHSSATACALRCDANVSKDPATRVFEFRPEWPHGGEYLVYAGTSERIWFMASWFSSMIDDCLLTDWLNDLLCSVARPSCQAHSQSHSSKPVRYSIPERLYIHKTVYCLSLLICTMMDGWFFNGCRVCPCM